MYQILTLNLGATSTKVSIFDDEMLVAESTLRHSDEELAAAPTGKEQLAYRKGILFGWLESVGVTADDLAAVVIRSTSARQCTKSGTYQMNQMLRDDLLATYKPDEPPSHVSTLVLPLADAILDGRGTPIYIVDSTYVDEFHDLARVSGLPQLPRFSTFHALNQKAVARAVAAELGKDYKACRLVVAHLGGGVSVGAHEYGRVIDSSNGGIAQDGPFSPNRTGALPIIPLVQLCFSGKYDFNQVVGMILNKGGFVAHTGLSDGREVEKRAAEGDETCDLVLRAFCYQVAKEIAAQCAVLSCEVDAIALTGGLSYSERIVRDIRSRVEKLAPVKVYPGEEEGPAMAAGALRVLRGEEAPIFMEAAGVYE